ncbi:hypothetical protein KR018_008604 [Drosophila ironensis]|nr:hypothetical protein KR018_008604 [Drosophila ironensis]
MRMRLLFIWVTLTALLQWTQAQEDNIQEISLSVGQETDAPEREGDIAAQTTKPSLGISVPTEQPIRNSKEETEEMGHQSGEVMKEPQETPTTAPEAGQSHKDDLTTEKSQVNAGESSMDTNQELPAASGESNQKPPVSPAESAKPPDTGSDYQDDAAPQEATSMDTNQGLPAASGEANQEPPASPAESSKPPDTGSDYQDDAATEEATTATPTTAAPVTSAIPSPVFSPTSCYTCMSCNQTIKNLKKQTCSQPKVGKNGCYTAFFMDAKDRFLARGCISDLTEKLSQYCEKNGQLCSRCYENDCNTDEMAKFEAAAGGAGTISLHVLHFIFWIGCLALI